MSYFGIWSFVKLHGLQDLYVEQEKNLPWMENFLFSDRILHHPPEPTSFAWEHFTK